MVGWPRFLKHFASLEIIGWPRYLIPLDSLDVVGLTRFLKFLASLKEVVWPRFLEPLASLEVISSALKQRYYMRKFKFSTKNVFLGQKKLKNHVLRVYFGQWKVFPTRPNLDLTSFRSNKTFSIRRWSLFLCRVFAEKIWDRNLIVSQDLWPCDFFFSKKKSSASFWYTIYHVSWKFLIWPFLRFLTSGHIS